MSPPGHASKQALGNEAPNSVRPPNATVYLQLQYLAPDEAQPRNFPPQFPITVRWGEDVDPPGASTHEETYRTTADGKLQFPARIAEGKAWKKFTLRFQSVSANQPRYIYVEKRGDALHPGFTTDLADVISRETPNRFFKIPNQWSLKQADWDLGKEKFGDNGKYTKATGALEHTKRGKGRNKNAPRDIGTSAKPVQLVLDPHWKFVRFEFFDRYYGPTFGDPARDGHGKRIGTPQLVLEGFRNKLDPALADQASTRSNWVIGADEDNLLQCLPFILRKAADGTAFQHTGANLGLRFTTTQEADRRTYIVSESKTARKLQHLGKNSPPASPPGPERLKAYDLPKIWKSKNWFVRETPSSPPAAGKFYDKLDAAAITKADTKSTPLIFCLDDIVLTGDSFVQHPIEDQDRVAVFFHGFSPPGAPGGDFSRLGVYKPGSDPHWRGYPYSDIQMPVRHYITNYPDWTRLVVAQGNLFDAFSERTTDVAENTVVGARAAVRWTWVTSPPNAAPLGTNKGAPNARTDAAYAAIQPFWRQTFANHSDNPQAAAIHHDEWAGAFAAPSPYYIGRFDLAHLRCTDWRGADEVTTVMRYIRYAFELSMVNTCPPVGAPYATPEMWAKEALDNITLRWNAGDAFNPGRPWITPKPSPPQEAPPLKAQLITLVQYVSPPACHFRIRTVAPTQGSYVNSRGDAQFRVNSIRHDGGGGPGSRDDWNRPRWAVPGRGLAAAHETGHAGSMPDEYPYSNPEECTGYKFLHIPANPFQYDFSNAHSCLMKGNGVIRTRYFWHAAEWLHSLPGLGVTNWKLEHGSARYGLSGNPSSGSEQWKQWRRDQVSALVRRVYAKIQSVKPMMKQSGSFVTWNPFRTASTRSAFQGTRPYYDVYSDWDSWIQEGIVDIAVPMTYYNYASLPSDWTKWINFEKDRKGNRHMIIGPGIYLNSLSNAILEIQQTRTASPAGNYANGFSGYSYRTPYSGGSWAGFSPSLLANVTQTWDDIPTMPWKTSPTKGHISGTVTYASNGAWADGATVTIAGPNNRTMTCDGTGFYAFIDVDPGSYTVTASKSGYPNIQVPVTVAIGAVTGNMYVRDFALGSVPAPIISNVQSSGVTNNAATITWTTDLASSSQVEYGTTTSYGSQTPVNGTPVTSHSVGLSGLVPDTLYHFRVISTAGGTTTSGDYTFRTLGPPALVVGPQVSTTTTTATVTWTTSQLSDGRVNYGLTSSYGSQASDPNTNTTSHSVTIVGLVPSTLFHYQCVSANVYGSMQTTDATFSTAAVSNDVIVDNTDPGWTNTSPGGVSWSVGSVAGVPKIGTNYLYRTGDGRLNETQVTRKCRWTPDLPVAGTYDVYAYYQIGPNRNPEAPYKVYYNGGDVTSIQNQYSDVANQGGWFLIGQDLPFAAGTAGYVELTSLSLDTRNVSADAAKWVLKVAADSTAPVMTSVTDEFYTTSTTSLQASWAATEPESTITRYDYAVGSYPEAVDVKGWTDAGTATSATISGMSLAVGGTYFISVRAVNDQGLMSDPMTSDGVTIARLVTSIANAKGFADDTPVCIPVTSVSAKFATAFYMQETGRASGIRVESSVGPAKDYTVQVYGRLGLVNGCERALLNCKIVPGALGTTVVPLLLNTGAVGGEPFGSYTPGITGGNGLNNIGLLATIAGDVTAVVEDGFYLDDGSGLQDDSVNRGIKVWTGAANSAAENHVVIVIGAVSCRVGTGGVVYPLVLCRDIIEP